MLNGSGTNDPDQDDLCVQTKAVGIAFGCADLDGGEAPSAP
jgi:hypothetical protein